MNSDMSFRSMILGSSKETIDDSKKFDLICLLKKKQESVRERRLEKLINQVGVLKAYIIDACKMEASRELGETCIIVKVNKLYYNDHFSFCEDGTLVNPMPTNSEIKDLMDMVSQELTSMGFLVISCSKKLIVSWN